MMVVMMMMMVVMIHKLEVEGDGMLVCMVQMMKEAVAVMIFVHH